MIISSAVSLAGVGVLSDHLRRRRPLIVGSTVLYLACWIAWFAGIGAVWTYVMAAFMGFSVSGFSLAWTCAKEVNRPRYAGMAISMANIGGFLSAGILQPLVGWVLDMGDDAAAISSGTARAGCFRADRVDRRPVYSRDALS
ncbi:MAG: hypothetical protein A3I62_04930 [Betaproteobacteria bacterium RIFCSPLOWO2_02_FULL_62_79]|nr:MAG: hypothetical protein A3I62_04930 [Betaproteobacteria bacterium RIFCSPLOWO2_02_FULL_62_79]